MRIICWMIGLDECACAPYEVKLGSPQKPRILLNIQSSCNLDLRVSSNFMEKNYSKLNPYCHVPRLCSN